MNAQSDPVSVEHRDAVALISINNPPVNALSCAVRKGLLEQVTAAETDDSVKAIVICCKGRTFIAGADIRELGQPLEEPWLPDVVIRIDACEKPVVAAIHGTALGGGLEVAMACHYRIATASAKVGLPEVKLGLLPGAHGTQRLPRLVGPELALDMMLSGNPLPAGEAEDAGLIDEIAQDTNLEQSAINFANKMVDQDLRRVRDLPVPDIDNALFDITRKKIAPKTRNLISPEKIIQCVEAATTVSYDEGCEFERRAFFACRESPQADGLMHSFFAHRAINKIPGIDRDTATRDLSSVAVLGAGTMGAGIAYACLLAGFEVYLLDADDDGLARGRETIRKLFAGGMARGKMSAEARDSCLARISTGTGYDELANCDLVIEAVFENMAVKKEVFAKLDKYCRSGAILATNTSTLDVDEIASATNRPQDVIGLHFFSPAHVMQLLEIVRGAKTSDDVLATATALARKLKKTGVVVGNCYGFVGNRMLYSYGRENQFLLLEGALPEYIDKTLCDWGMAMGPNAVGDLAGLDVGYKTREGRADLPQDPRFYRIANLLVEQGRYGQKTGKGMFLYEDESRIPVPDPQVRELIEGESEKLGIERRDIAPQEIIERCIYGLISEGARILEDGMAQRASDIDVVWINGYGFPAWRGGPMHFADTVGLDRIYETVCAFRDRFGAEYWEPPALLQELATGGRTFSDYDADSSGG